MAIENQELIVREHERFACRLPAMLRIESAGVVLTGAAADAPDALDVEVVDCSAGGAGLQTNVFLPRGCRMMLHIYPVSEMEAPGAKAAWALAVPVRIQRVAMISRAPSYYLGAAFSDLDGPQREMVRGVLGYLRASGAASPPSAASAAKGAGGA